MEQKNFMEKLMFYALITTHIPWILADTHIDLSPCKDRISVKKCRYLRRHFACITHKGRMETLCADTCGNCFRRRRSGSFDDIVNCKSTLYGCCRDDLTPAKGPNFFGCIEHCKDTRSKRYCVLIKKAGFCTAKKSAYYKDCLKTCEVCRECVDDPAEDCDHLLKHAFCDKKKVKATNHCRKSCHRCGKGDPCFGFRCNKNEKCRADNEGSPFCACQIQCEHDDHYTGQLCGRDGVQYNNLCHFKHKRCKSNAKVQVRNYGSCNSIYQEANYPTGLLLGTRTQGTIGIQEDDANTVLVPLEAHLVPGSEEVVGGCKDLSTIFCMRFIPACGYEGNRDFMRMHCPKTCKYCE